MVNAVLVLKGCCTKYHKLGGLKNRNSLPHSPGGWKSRIKASAGLVPSEAMRENCLQTSLLGLQMVSSP